MAADLPKHPCSFIAAVANMVYSPQKIVGFFLGSGLHALGMASWHLNSIPRLRPTYLQNQKFAGCSDPIETQIAKF